LETVHIHDLPLADLRFEKRTSSFQCLTFKRSLEICFVLCNAQKSAWDSTKMWSVHASPDSAEDSSINYASVLGFYYVCSILA